MSSNETFIFDAIRTPFGRYGGALSSVRTDDLAAVPIKALLQRQPAIADAVEEVIFGCANQAGEDNRNVARMAALLADLPVHSSAVTLNRLCGSGLDSLMQGHRAIRAGELNLLIAGGVESMSRAPFVMAKASGAFHRQQQLEDTTLGWRFINSTFEQRFGVDTMTQTAENLSQTFAVSREEQDSFALLSQQKAQQALNAGWETPRICQVLTGKNLYCQQDEHPRANTSLQSLQQLKTLLPDGTVTAGNASGINDGASAALLGSACMAAQFGLKPLARILGTATAGVEPRLMGMGPVPAIQKLLRQLRLTLDDFDLIEINEAFAAQVISCCRLLDISAEDPRLNAWGGAIAYGHPLAASGGRLLTNALQQFETSNKKRALLSMCIGVGQGIAIAVEKM